MTGSGGEQEAAELVADVRAWLDHLPSGAFRDCELRFDAAEVRDTLRTGASTHRAAPGGGVSRR